MAGHRELSWWPCPALPSQQHPEEQQGDPGRPEGSVKGREGAGDLHADEAWTAQPTRVTRPRGKDSR